MMARSKYRNIYRKMIAATGREIMLKVNNGTGWDSYGPVMAHIADVQETDLIANGSIQLGDLRVIFMSEDMPDGLSRMEQRDRITLDDSEYGVINWEGNTRHHAAAVEMVVRG